MRATAMEQATPPARSLTGRGGRSRRPGLPLVGAALALAFVLSGPAAALAIAAKPSEQGGVAGAAGSGPVAVTAKASLAGAEDEKSATTGGLVAAVQQAEQRAADRAEKAGGRKNPAGSPDRAGAAGGDERQEAAAAGSARERGRAAGPARTPGTGQAGLRAQARERAMHLTPRELRLLAQMIEAEAGAEPYEGKVAVGAVILNRVRSPLFPDTVEEVIFQPWQFEPVLNGWFWREPSAASWRAARDAARGLDPTGGALYFWNPAKSGYQPHLESRPSAGWIGNHRFAY
ncbi:cell wall hydrolase [Thermaerobacter subterraneus]|uniref:Cell Wall Hydrolase n=1 Tax=Thermaerobacter subterraneus DSM 13965 TaxID=867903 RepID=K6Q0H1_9FIRM|nr:cell wall hydrolase [Thermaerobacter subterraneus]EKP94399.1 Cell Wall Hydrolase [Thermaerobacter subterraneus DSM 13965]